MGYSTPGLSVLYHFPELSQTHVHWVRDIVQPSHPVIPSSSCLQSFPASGYFPMSLFFASGGQDIGASASVFPMNIQDWFPLGMTSYYINISLPHSLSCALSFWIILYIFHLHKFKSFLMTHLTLQHSSWMISYFFFINWLIGHTLSVLFQHTVYSFHCWLLLLYSTFNWWSAPDSVFESSLFIVILLTS